MAQGDPTDELEAAIYSTLSGDGSLTALLSASSAIYQDEAPNDASFPFVLFTKASGMPRHTIGIRNAYRDATYQVFAVVEGHSRTVANQISAAIDVALDGGLTVSGFTVGCDRRSDDIALTERGDGGRVFHRRGGLYRFNLYPT